MNTSDWIPAAFTFGTFGICFYCGAAANAIDHVIPFSFLTNESRDSHSRHKWITTHSCQSCNNLLSASIFQSLSDRCSECSIRIRHKFSRVLNANTWSEEEIKEFGHTLQSAIKRLRAVVVARLKWQESNQFREMFQEAFRDAAFMFPDNHRLHDFLFPPWERRSTREPTITQRIIWPFAKINSSIEQGLLFESDGSGPGP